jgi:WW domain-containing oxidoreductase
MIKGHDGVNGFGYASTAEQVTAGVDLSGKRVLITGVNSGLGAETARVLAARGARILGAARTLEKAREACASLPDAEPIACELSDPVAVRSAVAEIERRETPVDVIIANAGIMALPEREVIHGQEKQFFVNHVGHFILVTGLLEHLTDEARVVILSSAAHTRAPKGGIRFDDLSLAESYSPWSAYGQSKLANLLFARSLAKRFEGSKKTANAIHPGVIATNLGRHMPLVARAAWPILGAIALKSVPQGAATQSYVAAHPDAGKVNGEYWADCNVAESSRHGKNMEMAERLWEVTEEIVDGL